MNFKSVIFSGVLLTAGVLSFTACSDDDDMPKVPEVTEGLFILNNGKMNSNNSTLSYYDEKTKMVTDDVFSVKNGRKLGDSGQAMVVYGSKVYIAVYASNTIEITDKSGNSIKQISLSPLEAKSPRALVAHEGKVYISMYTGYLARLDTASMAIEKTVQVGRNPEEVTVSNGKLYVANSGGLDHNKPAGYDKTVSVVDVKSFTETKKIEVVLNPGPLVTVENGDVYLISMGNYGDIPNTLQRIDPKSDEVVAVEGVNATVMATYKNTLYMIYAQYGAPSVDYIAYDAASRKVVTKNFITDGTVIAKPFKISTNHLNGNIYIVTSDYKTNGDMYIFSSEGKKLNMFGVGLNPMGVYVVTNY